MSHWLYTQPPVAIFIIGLIASIVFMYVMAFFLKKTPILDGISDHEKEFLIAIQSGLVALSAIVLSFSLVLVITNYDHADANVAAEAARINDVDRLIHQYGDPKLNHIRADIRTYANSILEDEWPKLQTQEEGAETANLFANIAEKIGRMNPTTPRETVIYSELLRKLDDSVEMRETRLESAHIGLHGIYWTVNIAILFGVLFMSALGLILNKWLTAIGISMELAALVGLMTLVFICDHPFEGTVSVKPDPIIGAIKSMDSRK
ncbi:DUF4239 domain-containing protein [Polynucleobacter paneuropaeus]|nr:DUF4239 domain-containing protein [Polynucleobacter paneuropaeus]